MFVYIVCLCILTGNILTIATCNFYLAFSDLQLSFCNSQFLTRNSTLYTNHDTHPRPSEPSASGVTCKRYIPLIYICTCWKKTLNCLRWCFACIYLRMICMQKSSSSAYGFSAILSDNHARTGMDIYSLTKLMREFVNEIGTRVNVIVASELVYMFYQIHMNLHRPLLLSFILSCKF
jgi:hypothetical protein